MLNYSLRVLDLYDDIGIISKLIIKIVPAAAVAVVAAATAVVVVAFAAVEGIAAVADTAA
jgi:hypothetical protein